MRTAPFSFPGFNPSPQLAALIAQYTGGQHPGQQSGAAQQPVPQPPLPQPGGGGFGTPSPQMGGNDGGSSWSPPFGGSPPLTTAPTAGLDGLQTRLGNMGLPSQGDPRQQMFQRFAMMRGMTPQSANPTMSALTPLAQALMARFGNGAML